MTHADLIGEERLHQLCRAAIDASQAEQTQVTIRATNSSLTRFARSRIHQNVAERNYQVAVKVAVGKRVGYAEGNTPSEEAIRAIVASAETSAAALPEDEDFNSLPDASAPLPDVQTYFGATADFGPESRADAVAEVVKQALNANGATANGSVRVDEHETAIMNSFGLRAYAPFTGASLITLCEGAAGGTGWAEAHSRDAGRIDWAATARKAADLCNRTANPSGIEPGDYPVILMPYASIDLLQMLAWMGFDARSFQEGRSFMSGRLGQQIMSEGLSIWDDGASGIGWNSPFDGEGVAKQKVVLVENGIAKGVVYDSYTAGKEGRESTGHGSSGWQFRPYPANLFMSTGDKTVEEMIAGTDRGILVTRFHYTNVLKEAEAQCTGMTRDGTFLIENGKLARPVKNLRFTDSILRAFSGVEALGRDLMEAPGACAPAMKLKSFRFTSATEF